jgi:hypothetical protein
MLLVRGILSLRNQLILGLSVGIFLMVVGDD